MSIAVIVMGAAGRMGTTITRLVSESDDLHLVAVVERPEHVARVALPASVKVVTSLAEALEPGAVVIDFTAPEASMENARLVAKSGNPLIIGTTGVNAEQKLELAELAKHAPIFLSPNMSIGVNVLLDLLPKLTAMLGETYDVEVSEIHHNRKKDAPSGTALRLAEALAEGKGWDLGETACYCREGIIGERPHKEIGVQSLRGGDVVGVHTVYYFGPGERIEVTHQAHSRENFANGALRATRWIAGRKAERLFDMSDVLGQKALAGALANALESVASDLKK